MIPAPIPVARIDVNEFGRFAHGFHVGAAVANGLTFVLNVWLLVVHHGPQLFPSGYWWVASGVLQMIALFALMPNFRSEAQARVVLVLAYCLLFVGAAMSLIVWFAQLYAY